MLAIICIFIAVPMLINPYKILERPGCKIKSPWMIRAIAIFFILCAIFIMFV